MKRATTILSFSALAHLTVIDFLYFFFSPEGSINLFVILAYNIIWVTVALLVGAGTYVESRN